MLETIVLIINIVLLLYLIISGRKDERKTFKVKLDDYGSKLKHAHTIDAGYDIVTPFEKTIPARGSVVIDTGVHVLIPEGYVGILKSKSGLNIKHGIISTGVVDAGYTGSIVVKLYNLSDEDYTFSGGDKITQIVFFPIECIDDEIVYVDEFDETERGDNGFGSSGR